MSFLSRLFGGSPADASRLTPAEFQQVHGPDRVVVDVRTASEFAGGHLDGAYHADVMASDFDARIDRLELDPSAPVYLYCRSGNRSGQAADRLRARGFAQAINVGGFDALAAAGLPTVR